MNNDRFTGVVLLVGGVIFLKLSIEKLTGYFYTGEISWLGKGITFSGDSALVMAAAMVFLGGCFILAGVRCFMKEKGVGDK